MASEKQVQKAGENSQQIQAQSIIIHNGIEEKRAREIFMEMFAVAKKDLTNEAFSLATQRVTNFENDLIPKMGKVHGAMNAFADPDFQFLLTSAHKTAATTDREADYSLLSELLLRRIQKGDNRKTRVGIRKAVEIVDEISDDALLGLTVAFAVQFYQPITGSITDGLDVLDGLFKKICYDRLPENREWLDHLDILDAVRPSTFVSIKKYEDFYSEKLSGFCAVGIKKNSDDYTKVIEMIKEVALPENILCNHELNEEYVRLEVASEKSIDSLAWTHFCNLEGKKIPIKAELSDNQKQQLHRIYKMYENNGTLKADIKKRFCDELVKRPYLNIVREWWNKIPSSFTITAVGKVLAHANAKRNDETLPDLD
ncbi:hypothetical protein SANA_20260 [Gottschalkiaceae bacterium SANA]|nr:hypothetical protein SANA_20260 [Gottschalkiaceae bacterium SANA]